MSRQTQHKVSKQFKRHLAEYYAYNKFATFESMAVMWHVSPEFISNSILEILEDTELVDDITAERAANKAINCFPKGKAQRTRRWEKPLDVRREKKLAAMRAEQAKIEEEKSRIEEIEFQIASYDDYFIEEEGAPSKESLLAELHTLKARPC